MARTRTPLDDYMSNDTDMERYLHSYGRHFSRKMYEFAVSKMYRLRNGMQEKMHVNTKEAFDERMKRNNVVLENDVLYDGMYVMSMAESDFLGSSIVDERHLCLFVKDYIDDPDQADGFVFNRFLASIRLLGEPIDWDGML